MISIILCGTDKAKGKAKKIGFTEQTVLIRHESIFSSDIKKKEEIEAMIMHDIRPYQFLVSDFWGMGNPS